MPDYEADRRAAILWAQSLLSRTDWVILDFETTGIRWAEIVQIGLLSATGQVLMDTLVQPQVPIPPAATAIHGITDAMVAGAPTLSSLMGALGDRMVGKEVVVFNVGYDKGTLRNALARRWDERRADDWTRLFDWTCAMEPYSAFLGDWSDYHGSYKFQRLPGGNHSAIGDCRATLDVIKMMAEANP